MNQLERDQTQIFLSGMTDSSPQSIDSFDQDGQPRLHEVHAEVGVGEHPYMRLSSANMPTGNAFLGRANSKSNSLFVIGVLLVGSFVALYVSGIGNGLGVDDLLTMLGHDDEPIKPAVSTSRSLAGAPPSSNPSASLAKNPESLSKKDINEATDKKDIWAAISNDFPAEAPPRLGPPLTAGEVEKLNRGLRHKFNFQRHKAILDAALRRAEGSEPLLEQGLESKKLWTRLYALIGLADLSREVSRGDVAKALGGSSSDVVARFFQRFERSACTRGCFYVARAVLPHLDEYGRRELIRVIGLEQSEVSQRFVAAATYDASGLVRKAANGVLAKKNIDPSVWTQVRRAVGQI